MQLFINNWSTALALPATASAVQLSVPEADAALLTGLGTGDHYLLTLAIRDINGIETAWEVVRVTAHTAGVLDVLRAQEGTTALELEAGTAISARLTQATMETLRDSGGPALSDALPQALGAASAGTSPDASRSDHAHALPTPAAIGAATAAQGAAADSAVQPGALAAVATSGAYADLTGTPSIPSTAAEVGAIAATEKGAALGVATLDAGGLVPAAQLPSYVDDVLEYADLASLPVTGETGKIYVTLDDSRQYRWSGSAYTQMVASPGTTDNVPEGSTNLYHSAARVLGTVLAGLSLATSTAVAATDTALQAIGKLAARMALKEQTLTAGSNVTIDRTDPDNPIISASITGGGGGDVVGPASAIANEVALFDGITGKLLKGGGALGTAAATAATDYATAAQGALAATAVQPGALGTAAAADTGDFTPAAHAGAGGPAHADVVAGGDSGFMTGTQATKLDGIASGATANDTDANLKSRANHTGEQATSTITGLDAALAARALIAGLPSRDVTASGAVTPADAGKWLICNSATPITLTIGAEATAAWTTSGILPMFHILQIGAGAVTVTGDGFSVTYHTADTNVLAGAGAAATALWRASNTWSLIGRLVAA